MFQIVSAFAIVASLWLGARALGHGIKAVGFGLLAASGLIGLELLGIDVAGAVVGIVQQAAEDGKPDGSSA